MGTFSLADAVTVATRDLASDAYAALAREEGRLRVTGTVPGVSTVTAEADCPGFDFGPVHVYAQKLARAVAASGAGCTVRLAGEGRGLRVEIEHGRVRVAIGASTEAPLRHALVTADVGPGGGVLLQGEQLRRALWTVLPYVAGDDNRYGLNGIHFEPGGDHVLLVATDGNRLCAARVDPPVIALPPGTLARRAAAELLLLDDTGGGSASLAVTATHLVYRSPSLQVTSTLLKADFPRWRQVVPTSWPRHADVETKTLRAITSAACEIGGPEANTTVRLDIRRDGTRASCRYYELSCEAVIDGAANFEGAVGLNARFLDVATWNLAGPRVTLEMGDSPLGPVRVRDAGDPDSPLAILMPVRMD